MDSSFKGITGLHSPAMLWGVPGNPYIQNLHRKRKDFFRFYPSLTGTDPTASSRAQPAWPQLQESSIVPLASLQYWLQYLLFSGTEQVQAGWAHFFLSDMSRHLHLRFQLGEVPVASIIRCIGN